MMTVYDTRTGVRRFGERVVGGLVRAVEPGFRILRGADVGRPGIDAGRTVRV